MEEKSNHTFMCPFFPYASNCSLSSPRKNIYPRRTAEFVLQKIERSRPPTTKVRH